MSSALENAKRRALEIQKELEEIQRFIALHEHFSTMSSEQTQKVSGVTVSTELTGIPVENSFESEGAKKRRQRGLGPTPKAIVEMVERFMREAAKPLTRGEIAEMMAARDVVIPAEDKPRYIGTIMWRNKSKFVNIEGWGYWLRGEPVPAPRPEITLEEDDIDSLM